MESSPRSVTSTLRRAGEQPVVSGLGLSSSSEASETLGPACQVPEASAVAAEAAGWEQPRPSRREKWRCRHSDGAGASRGPPLAREHREVSPEMVGLCFKCFKEGHYKKDCTNQVVCFRCKLPVHESKDCKRPRSPSPEEDLRRLAAAKVARRDQAPPARAVGLARRPAGSPMLPPPPPPSALAAPAAWPRLYAPHLESTSHEELNAQELCVVRRT